MAETTFGICAFIRLAGLKRGQAVSEMKSRKYRQTKGFNPYLHLNRQIKSWSLGLVDHHQVIHQLSNSGRDCFKQKNPKNFARTTNWITNSGFQALPISEIRYCHGPLDVIRIKSDPTLLGYYQGQKYCIEVWHTESPKLSRWMIALGIGLMERAFAHDEDLFGNFAILDPRRNRLYSRINVSLPRLDIHRVLRDHEYIWREISVSSNNRAIIDANRNREFGFGELHPY